MSKKTKVQPPEAQADTKAGPHTTSFGFFQRHQKLIIYTAGIFTLLTFSITGAMMDLFGRAGQKFENPKLNIAEGLTFEVTQEDIALGRDIWRLRELDRVRNGYSWLPNFQRLSVLPMLYAGKSASNTTKRMGCLRRLAVEAGMIVSEDVVEQSLEADARAANLESVGQLGARLYEMRDTARFRRVSLEAARITMFLQLACLGAGTSEDTVVKTLVRQRKNIAFKVAVLDSEKIEEEFRKTKVTKVQLVAWMAELEKQERWKYHYPTNKTAIKIGFVERAKFDLKPHEELLKDFVVSDAEIDNYYLTNRDTRFLTDAEKKRRKEIEDERAKKEEEEKKKAKEEADRKKDDGKKDEVKKQTPVFPSTQQDPEKGAQGKPTSKPVDDTPTKTTTTEGEQGEGGPGGQQPQKPEGPQPEIPQDPYKSLKDVREEIVTHIKSKHVMKEWRKQIGSKLAEYIKAEVDLRIALTGEANDAREARDTAKVSLDDKPEDEALKKALEAAKKKVEEVEKALEAAEKVVDDKTASFDFEKAMKEVAKTTPVTFHTVEEPGFPKDLEKLPNDLGTWRDSSAASGVQRAGEVHSRVQEVEKGLFLFQVSKLIERPEKPWDDIKEDVENDYFVARSDKASTEKKEKFEEALKRLSRAKCEKEIAALEKERDDKVKEKLDKWAAGLQDKLGKLSAALDGEDLTTRNGKQMLAMRDRFQKELADKEKKEQEFQDELKTEYEDKIAEKARTFYKDVLDEAAKAGGFAIEKLGPLPTDLQRQPGFERAESKTKKYVFANTDALALDKDEATEVLEDMTERRFYVIVCTDKTDKVSSDVNRREWKYQRDGETRQGIREQLIQTPMYLYQLSRQQLPPEEQALLQKAVTGDKEAARELVYRPLISPYIEQSYTGSPEGLSFDVRATTTAALQSFTMEAIEKAYGFKEPEIEDPDQKAGETKPGEKIGPDAKEKATTKPGK